MTSTINATYELDTATAPERAADIIAGEQSSGTFVAIPGEDEALKARAAATWQITPLNEPCAAPNKRSYRDGACGTHTFGCRRW